MMPVFNHFKIQYSSIFYRYNKTVNDLVKVKEYKSEFLNYGEYGPCKGDEGGPVWRILEGDTV